MSFISALGYNVFNPTEVILELNADIGLKKGEKVDDAILRGGKPIILIECKHHATDLSKVHASQLYRYFSVADAANNARGGNVARYTLVNANLNIMTQITTSGVLDPTTVGYLGGGAEQ